jgi:hypothetical protein
MFAVSKHCTNARLGCTLATVRGAQCEAVLAKGIDVSGASVPLTNEMR